MYALVLAAAIVAGTVVTAGAYAPTLWRQIRADLTAIRTGRRSDG